MNIKDYLSTEIFKTRKQLVEETGLTDRAIRNKISELKQKETVLYNSQTAGYRLARPIDQLKGKDLEEEMELVKHCINDIEARKEKFNNQERQYIAYLKVAEKYV